MNPVSELQIQDCIRRTVELVLAWPTIGPVSDIRNTILTEYGQHVVDATLKKLCLN
jgi:hypothetical protein